MMPNRFLIDDIVIVKPGLREPKLQTPKVGVVVDLLSENVAHPEWNYYRVLIDESVVDVPARRLKYFHEIKHSPGLLFEFMGYITNVTNHIT